SATFNALSPSLATLGPANTDWASAITRTSVTHNHNLALSGGSEATRYRASLNYAKEEGVTLSTGLERIQGRWSATHSDLNGGLRIGDNGTTARTARVNVRLDHSSGDRQEYHPNASPVGVSLGNGLAQQQNLDNATQTIQTQLTYQRQFGDANSLDVVGGYEYSKFRSNWVQ